MSGASDRARALFAVFLLISFAMFLYLVHVRRQGEVETRKGEASSLLSDIERSFGSGVTENASSVPAPTIPQNIMVQKEKERLRALGAVRIGDELVEGVEFIVREEEKWLRIEKALFRGSEIPCRGIMREGATHLLVWECGGKNKKQ
ncbi:MAG TPA: hypothetical protein P5077_11035 [bacterium]|nr:hypothetical protein [bacterium]